MTHLSKRNGVYYFRRKIPLELRHLYQGKAEVIFSLQTKNRAEAEPLARKAGVQYDEEFAKARAEALETTNNAAPSPSPARRSENKPKLAEGLAVADFDLLVARYIQRMREHREEAAKDQRSYEQYLMYLRGVVADCKEYLKTGEHPLEDVTRPLWQVEAQLKAAKAMLKGKAPELSSLGNFPHLPSTVKSTAQRSLTTMDSLVARWAIERKPDPRSITYYTRSVTKFQEYVGVIAVEQVSKQDVAKYKDKLLEHGTTTATTNSYLVNLTTLFNFAINNAIIESNPAQGIRVQVREEDTRAREPFTVEQLNLLFASPVYSENQRPKGGKGDAAYWLPLLGLFTGARLNELCQMSKVDVRSERYYDAKEQEHECWVIEFTDSGEGQRLKNTTSRRRIPVHPVLIELGFVEFVKASPGPRVFHELTASKAYGSISASWSKWFARYLAQIGLKSESLVFHSFRHAFKFYARQNLIADNVQYALLGHSSGNVGDSYGGSVYPLAPLVEAMGNYQIPRLRLPKSR